MTSRIGILCSRESPQVSPLYEVRQVGHARSWPCLSHVYSLETWDLLLLGCFCWPAARAVAGITRPLVALAAVLCCAVATAAVDGGCRIRRSVARRLPTTAAAAGI